VNARLLLVLVVAGSGVGWQIISAGFDNGFLDVDPSVVDLCEWVVAHQVVRNFFLLEVDESEASALSREDILQDDGVHNFTKLAEVLLQLLIRQFEVEATDENFRIWVLKLDFFSALRVVLRNSALFLFTNHIRVRFLDLLTAGRRDGLVPLVGQ
jgi:hypothetical protein